MFYKRLLSVFIVTVFTLFLCSSNKANATLTELNSFQNTDHCNSTEWKTDAYDLGISYKRQAVDEHDWHYTHNFKVYHLDTIVPFAF